ncbi:Decaprenyl diphosphate synthase-like protein [Suillus variegatus]|nr:Decaprenyl diphosphate synthase-like protein [Suillus variegatus]
MVGNRPFARLTGRRTVEDICIGFDTRHVTVHAFAIANFNRPFDEVCTLMKLAEDRLVKIAQDGALLGQYVSHRELLPMRVQVAIDKAKGNDALITEQIIEENLITSLWGSPPLEIFIRTSGVKRLSSFLQWQVFHVVNTYWPDFSLWDFGKVWAR